MNDISAGDVSTARVVASPDLREAVACSRIEQALFGAGELVRIGRYVLLKHLGEGGFGEVHIAFDTQLNRRVALKLLRRNDVRAPQLMLREAQALARVAHPNVVAVHDAGTFDDPRGATHLFIVMEYAEGRTLRAWMNQPRTWRTIVAAFVAAGRGLEAVHRAGLVHHDFKPGNVIVADDGRVRVLDFGLARLRHDALPPADEGVSAAANMAADALAEPLSGHAVAGTPPYMAPEQLSGRPSDARVDVYAFAVTLFEALYGVRPFRETSHAVMFADKRNDRVIDPPQRGVPLRICALLRRALSADPRARFPELGPLLAALERRPARRSMIALGVAASLGIGAAAWWHVQRERDRMVDHVDELARAAHEAAARALFVYPPADAADTPTALLHVLELEALGDAAADGEARALRTEFAQTLVRLGDRYWDEDGGRSFALDYYVEALVFVPDQEHALQRAAVSIGRVLALEQQAATASFTAAQLQSTEPLRALAQEDPAARQAAIAEQLASEKVAASARGDLQRLLGTHRQTRPERSRVDAPQAPGEPSAKSVEAPAPASDELASTPVTESTPPTTSVPTVVEQQRRDPDGAREQVALGRAAFDRGDDKAAEQAYHRALDLDARAADAHAGLSTLYFERRSYRRARDHARKAAMLQPRVAAHEIAAGDAAFKLAAYSEARHHYAAAQRLGSTQAERRLATVSEVVGDP